MITVARFKRLEGILRAMGYGPIIDWSQNIDEPTSADAFAREAAFVIINSGFKNSIAAPISERCMVALNAGHSASTEVGHPGKHKAIDEIWSDREKLFDAYMNDPDKIEFLQTLPWIGKVTCYHLGKNLGLDHAKPDVHMERLARREGLTTDDLCQRLARHTGYRVATVDTVLWRACADGLLNSVKYEAGGWREGFQPKRFRNARS